MLECYVRVYNGQNPSENTTANQMFEIETQTDTLERSGFPLEWQEDAESDNQVCKVHLRHFISGRLLQVSFFKNEERMG